MGNINSEIEKLSEVYEKAKDNLIRITITNDEHALQTDLFENIKRIRDIAAEAIQSRKDQLT